MGVSRRDTVYLEIIMTVQNCEARVTPDEDPLAPVHPGEILLEEFIKPYGLTAGRTAARLNIARPRIEKLVRGQTPITVDTALRLERLFGSSAQFWLNLQNSYDLKMAKRGLTPDIVSIEPFAA
jgi:addiction module HigA family antidote